MSPTLQIDADEGFSDWSEFYNPQCGPSEDSLEEYVEVHLDKGYLGTQQDRGSFESYEGVTTDKRGTLLVRSAPTPGEGRLAETLRKARELTGLADNWDDEGSLGYSIETWRRVRRFLLLQSSLSAKVFQMELPIPQINPADQGSMDVFWRLPRRQLLVNFPKQSESPITYYGRDETGRNTVTGRTQDSDPRQDLVAWLIQTTI
jgi:hypothetical protein